MNKKKFLGKKKQRGSDEESELSEEQLDTNKETKGDDEDVIVGKDEIQIVVNSS